MGDAAILIAAAFVFGVGAGFVRLPPLVGFLVAGFALNAMGFEHTPWLDRIGDLGVTLLLFTIGLKLRVGTLLRAEVWGGALLHMGVFVAAFGVLFQAFTFGLFGGLEVRTSFLLAFALSFSSTVFAVKAFEEGGRGSSLHARTAIGVLIIQDLVAVAFMAASKGQPPSIWALGLFLLIPLRPSLRWLIDRVGHGELLMLLSIMLAFGGYALFEAVNLKGDLGAIAFGMLIADHPKTREMADWLMGFKDLFLVGFFLGIGLGRTPSAGDLGVALVLVALVPIKTLLYFLVLTRFRLRARTATMTSLSLATYSEFGLIVGLVAVKLGSLTAQWLSILAVAVALTFIAAAPLNAVAHRIYDRLRERLLRFQTPTRIPEERPVDVGAAEVLIFGMGRVGTGAYDTLCGDLQDRVVGVDNDEAVVAHHAEEGRVVVKGDPTDLDFWDRIVADDELRAVMLALPSHQANLDAIEEIRRRGATEKVRLTAIARHDDEARELEERGANAAFNLYARAGQGYADLVRPTLD